MEMIMTALALVAGAQAAAGSPVQPAEHTHHQQGMQHSEKDCCCRKEATDGKKMACCEKPEKAKAGEHAGHSNH
jgi:hypothetical protein